MDRMESRRGYAAVLLIASGGTFLSMLDSTVINLAVTDLARDFDGASLSRVSWVITAYVVLFAALLAPAGKLADALGRRRLFLVGISTFTVMSLACAAAPTLPLLIGARAVQGAAAAAMIPAALAILLIDGPADRRAMAIGVWSAASALAAGIGPTVGGVLVDAFGWRSLFFINLPFGLAIIAGTLLVLPKQTDAGGLRKAPDPLATILLAAGIGAVTLGISEGERWGWDGARTLGCVLGGVLAIGLALWRSSRARVPAVDVGLWRNRTFVTANVVSLFYGATQFPWLLGGVLWTTEIWRYDETKAGLAMTPGAIAAAIGALGLGRLTARRGPRPTTLFGLVALVVTGTWLVLAFDPEPAFLTLWLPAGILGGLAMGATTVGTSTAAALSAPPIRFASASGTNTMARQVGGALGIAMLAAILGTGAVTVEDFQLLFTILTGFATAGLLVAAVALRFPAAPPAPATAPVSAAEGR